MVELGKQLKARRKELGLTQVDLADLAEVSDRFVRSAEQGKPSLRFDTLLKVLDALGLDFRVEVRR